VFDQISRHPWHVCWFPREDVSVSPEEADERVFLFGVEAHPDGGGLDAVACPEVNRLDLNLLSCLRLVGVVDFFGMSSSLGIAAFPGTMP
jgi:hypothetical protein